MTNNPFLDYINYSVQEKRTKTEIWIFKKYFKNNIKNIIKI